MVRGQWDHTKIASETNIHNQGSCLRRGRMIWYETAEVQLSAFLILALDKDVVSFASQPCPQIQSRCIKEETSCLHRGLNHDSSLIQPVV
jgi:hypothetical protein